MWSRSVNTCLELLQVHTQEYYSIIVPLLDQIRAIDSTGGGASISDAPSRNRVWRGACVRFILSWILILLKGQHLLNTTLQL